ncbi:hypothetical protein CMV_006281 [Castanea mollissima]|uniref:Uncharacterized protein n=1 Tax=Castanea mollissima TaxID=60419 RepID=A0A8J4RB02_9ROSI|nr:hypothetical protein CMV_006281 [Castanea mollissima]
MILESHQVLQNASSMCSVPSLKVSSAIQTYNNFKASWSVSVSSKMNLHCTTPAERGHHQVMFGVVPAWVKLGFLSTLEPLTLKIPNPICKSHSKPSLQSSSSSSSSSPPNPKP